jgi:hypothetical protein
LNRGTKNCICPQTLYTWGFVSLETFSIYVH